MIDTESLWALEHLGLYVAGLSLVRWVDADPLRPAHEQLNKSVGFRPRMLPCLAIRRQLVGLF